MKKKIMMLLLIFTSVFLLMGCMDVRATTPYGDGSSEHEKQVISAVKKAEGASVVVKTDKGHGSGVIFKKIRKNDTESLYYVLTNHHVIEEASDIYIYYGVRNGQYEDLRPSSISYYAQDVQSTAAYDIAVVRFVAPSNLQVDILEILATDENKLELVKGQTVIAIGSPYNWETYFNFVSLGVLSQYNYDYNGVKNLSIKHDVAINPGNSGGMLINLKGELIGINTSKIATISTETGQIAAEGLGTALNVNVFGPHVLAYLEIGYEKVVKAPRLGITIVSMTDYVKDASEADLSLIAKRDTGVVVISVDSNRGAYNIVKQYDVIIAANGIDITDNASLAEALGTMQYGQTHRLTVIRIVNGSEVQMDLTVVII